MTGDGRALEVFLGERGVGVLEADDLGRLTFTYADRDPLSRLSISLRPQLEPYADAECRPFFAGLLPEGEALAAAAERRRLQPYETFNLLREYGAECAGAVRLLQPGSRPEIPQDYEPLEEADLARIIDEIPASPNSAGDRRVRLSLAGAQPKTAVALLGGRFYRPLNGSPSTHLVKVAPAGRPDFALVPKAEAFSMALAANLGVDVAGAALRSFGGRECLLVERYDRRVEGGRIHEIHQEDFCQALGYPPERKYEFSTDETGEIQKVGPGLSQCLGLARQTAAPLLVRAELIRRVIATVLLANADAHAKNFSLLYDAPGRAPSLAPAYDVLCTRIFPVTEDLAMAIGSAIRPTEIRRVDWLMLAPAGAPGALSALEAAVKAQAETVLPKLDALRRRPEFAGIQPYEDIRRCVAEVVRSMASAFGWTVPAEAPPYLARAGGWAPSS
ncbi:HipA domain-containing protein [Nitrospirillum sp. BR 11163]|uniref:HipA domain-containing protein n=1 Tax=Nitrospirillum sp. BR 11163 TaxID=3104323 RepID=UPI002AFE1BB9|nr:HipA domain-containing protein [Nitrospirillum sp. BR 11163]MEA1677385.1 HipA domain-containing protein [Nitrospirillum sp. BR 11163]